MASVRVRFAPSPTGFLHIGGVRTALYAWLWAKKQGGDFVLRIEDTDAERSTKESVDVIFESMKWLGLDWDEGPDADGSVTGDHGPYFQTQRTAIYKEYAEKLIAAGKAYRCFATKEEIAEQRAAYEKEHGKRGFRFQSPWRDRTDGDASEPHVVRFKAPKEGETGWDDLVFGHVAYPNSEQQDFVLIRQNDLPLYNFACFVDDLTMGITLVTRGEDHLINTPQQLLLFAAAGETPPQYAHLPLVCGADGKKLSKRHASVSVLSYRDEGFVPDGVLNYLARLGWSAGDQEIFTRAELIEKFDWANVGKTAGKWDSKKLEHVQSQHLRAIDDAELAKLVVPFLAARGVEVDAADPKLVAAIGPVQLRTATLIELAEGLDYFFRPDDALEYEAKGKKKFLTPELAQNLEKLAEIIETVNFDAESLEAAVVAWIEAAELKMKFVAQPARMALSGRTRSPGLYETITLIGKESCLVRLRRAIEVAKSNV